MVKPVIKTPKQSNRGVSIKPVIAIHGLQGSGKTFLYNHLSQVLSDQPHKLINIKSTFAPVVDAAVDAFSRLGYDLDVALLKQLQLRLSTFGEHYLSESIWTDIFVRNVSEFDGWAIADDIRTRFNIKGLRTIALTRPVILFTLDVPEETRRKRLGSAYRENGSYTERLVEKPANLPDNFAWVDLGENWSPETINQALKDYL